MKTAWITGASRGIGKAIALALAKQGYAIAIHYRADKQSARLVKQEIETGGGQALLCQGDVAKEEDMKAIHQQIENAFGMVDVLVHNAGIAQQKLFTDISLQEWNRMLAVHMTGAFLSAQAVLPAMISKKAGKVILLSSMWGQVGASCEVHYSAAKAGMIGMMKALAKEVAPCNIQVNAIAPGVIATEMMDSFMKEEIMTLCEEIPMGYIGKPEDIANVVCFLCSKAAKYMTGQVISPNGGMVV